jgi:UDP-N-acetylglucosamine 2-epimerase (non-hydrolysing)
MKTTQGKPIKILNVVGARPNFMKMAPIMQALAKRRREIEQRLIHTGQHYDDAMSGSFFRDLGMQSPDIHLETRGGSYTEQTTQIMLAFEKVLTAEKPDWVVVVGDVNSTLACALVANKMSVRTAHVEAGLRSFDREMPEEINRLLTDRLSDLLLTPSKDADANLLREGVEPLRIVRVGNVMIDTLFRQIENAKSSQIVTRLELDDREYAVLTLHRPSNVDDPIALEGILGAMAELCKELPIIFPVHPRTRSRIEQFGLCMPPELRLIEPLGYVDFLRLWSGSRLTLTDSGGLQEETTALGVPCLTLRENTERPITIEEGTNQLVGRDPVRILAAAREALSASPASTPRVPELWDGRTAERIADVLIRWEH